MSKVLRELRARQTPEQRTIGEWVYEVTMNPILSTVILGMAEAVATAHPKWTHWQVMEDVRSTMNQPSS